MILQTDLLSLHTTQDKPNLLGLLLNFPSSSLLASETCKNRFQMIPAKVDHAAIIPKRYEICRFLGLMVRHIAFIHSESAPKAPQAKAIKKKKTRE